jgi:hypothetical protein
MICSQKMYRNIGSGRKVVAPLIIFAFLIQKCDAASQKWSMAHLPTLKYFYKH